MRTMFVKLCGFRGYHFLTPRRNFITLGLLCVVALVMLLHFRWNKKDVSVIVVEEHHEALSYWHHLTVTHKLNRTGNTLIHIDGHSDMASPEVIPGFPFFEWPIGEGELYTMMQKNDVFIQGAIIIGMIDHVIWIYPSWDKSAGMREYGDYSAVLLQLGYMNRIINGKNTTIICECHTAVNRHNHRVESDAESECMYLDETKKIEESEVNMPKSECHIMRSALFEVIVDEMALEVLEKSAWVTKPNNVILDIDEDFFGCERGGDVLVHAGIKWGQVERLDELIRSMVCPRNTLYEEKADVFMKDLIVDYMHACNLDLRETCSVSARTVLNTMTAQVVDIHHRMPRLFCQSETITLKLLEEVIAVLRQLNKAQLMELIKLGFCLNTSPASYGFYDGRSEFTICHGANTPNDTLVELYVPVRPELQDRMTMLHSMLQHLSALKPGVVTLCRSIRDGYTPRHLVNEIEDGIIEYFQRSQTDLKYNIIYDDNLLGGDGGWNSRYMPNIK